VGKGRGSKAYVGCTMWSWLPHHVRHVTCAAPKLWRGQHKSHPLPALPHQVESYMAKVVDKMRSELRGILADAVSGPWMPSGGCCMPQLLLAHADNGRCAMTCCCCLPAGARLPLQEARQVHFRLALPDHPGRLGQAQAHPRRHVLPCMWAAGLHVAHAQQLVPT